MRLIKMNRKGFMMAELVVVSSVLIITLVGLYSSYSNLYVEYMKRISYNDVTTLYRLGYYRDYFFDNGSLATNINTLKNDVNKYSLEITGSVINTGDRVFLIENRNSFIDINKISGVFPTFMDYVDYFNDAVDYRKFNYVLILERCVSDDNMDDCSYAYLDVYENRSEYNILHSGS